VVQWVDQGVGVAPLDRVGVAQVGRVDDRADVGVEWAFVTIRPLILASVDPPRGTGSENPLWTLRSCWHRSAVCQRPRNGCADR
jgi:hypothetical protein